MYVSSEKREQSTAEPTGGKAGEGSQGAAANHLNFIL